MVKREGSERRGLDKAKPEAHPEPRTSKLYLHLNINNNIINININKSYLQELPTPNPPHTYSTSGYHLATDLSHTSYIPMKPAMLQTIHYELDATPTIPNPTGQDVSIDLSPTPARRPNCLAASELCYSHRNFSAPKVVHPIVSKCPPLAM